jgi:pyruvate, water dikinase
MATIWKMLKKAGRRRPPESPNGASHTFEARYHSFKELLAANAHLLNIMADIEVKLQGHRVFGMTYVRSQASQALFYTMRMVLCLNFIAAKKYLHLMPVLEAIHREIQTLIDHPKPLGSTEFVLPLTQVSKKMLDWVGGKNANLGEVCSVLKIPTPAGFAITTTAFENFMAHNGLSDSIHRCLDRADPDRPQSIAAASTDIERLILEAELPPDLEWAIAQAPEALAVGRPDGSPRPLAMRSSAVGEDSQWTFAGQYCTVLNVPREKVVDAYRRVVAGLYTERAMMYRIGKGIADADMAMGVTGLEMVPAVSSGVVYSRDPLNPARPHVIVNGVWGLGPYAVEGVITPDQFRVDRNDPTRIVEQRIAVKPVQLVMASGSGVQEAPVADPLRERPCLRPDQLQQLARWALDLEAHFGEPQDMEWALAPDGALLVLQTRPLQMVPRKVDRTLSTAEGCLGYPVLAEHGVSVFPGVGTGSAYHVRNYEDLARFPQGAILVARRSSPSYVMVMPKARAIITEVGSITGHMASLARELRVPTVLGLEGVMESVAPGLLITVDAYAGVVYEGCVTQLENLEPPPPSIQDLPSWRTLRQVADWIVPLHLTDPKSPDFRPEACRSLHDITRVVHELCYQEMFKLSDLVSYRAGTAVKLDVKLPVDLYLIDLGGGLADGSPATAPVPLAAVTSIPFNALLRGMLHPDLGHQEPRPIHLSGFFAVMREQILSPPSHVERFGDRSYAIIADKYLNFSSRVGYHYSILDCYCGASINKNYITFSFKGGAADDTRRNRRVRAIALILEALDFTVEVRGDRVDARLLKYEQPVIEAKLDQIGRLLQYTRQMDMLMNCESSVALAAQSFMAGNYALESNVFRGRP